MSRYQKIALAAEVATSFLLWVVVVAALLFKLAFGE